MQWQRGLGQNLKLIIGPHDVKKDGTWGFNKS